MTDNNYALRPPQKAGDMAVNGLLAGLAAGAVMLVYLLLTGLLVGRSLLDTLMLFNNDPAATPLTGALLHMAIAAIYGLLFGTLMLFLARWRRLAGLPFWAIGLGYGLLLLLLAQSVLLPSSDSPLAAIPLLHWLLAHILYGIALGIGMRRSLNN